jgi:hypothetical protein
MRVIRICSVSETLDWMLVCGRRIHGSAPQDCSVKHQRVKRGKKESEEPQKYGELTIFRDLDWKHKKEVKLKDSCHLSTDS